MLVTTNLQSHLVVPTVLQCTVVAAQKGEGGRNKTVKERGVRNSTDKQQLVASYTSTAITLGNVVSSTELDFKQH